jgi:SAM-dependent methyltransferase
MFPEKVNYSSLESEYSDPDSLSSKKIKLVDSIIPNRGNLLDIGIGTGQLIMTRLYKHEIIYGLDIDDRSLTICNKKFAENPNVTLIGGGFEDLPILTDIKFDCITCLDVLEHIDEKLIPSALHNIHDALNDDGMFIFSGPGIFEKIRIILGKSPTHLHSHSSYGWKRMIQNEGFSIVSMESVEFPLIDGGFLRQNFHLLGKCCVIVAKKREI